MSSVYTPTGVDPVARPKTQFLPSFWVFKMSSLISCATRLLDCCGADVTIEGILSFDLKSGSLSI